jgi:hypothetical protein
MLAFSIGLVAALVKLFWNNSFLNFQAFPCKPTKKGTKVGISCEVTLI